MNIILDPVFIFLLGMGVEGAAFATICSQFLSAVFVIRFLTGKRAELKLKPFGKIGLKAGRIMDIISLGAASFAMQCTNSLVQIASNSMLSTFGGDMYISIMAIINSVRQILDTPVLAITDGSSPILSYNYGAGNYKGVKKAVKLVVAFSLTYTILVWAIVLVIPSAFIRIFNSDSTLITAAVPALHTYFFAYIFQALMYSGQAVFKSLNKKKQAIFFSLLRKVIIVVPLTYLLPHVGNLGVLGVFAAEPVSNVLGGGACFVTMLFMMRRYGRETEIFHVANGDACC